MKTYPTYRYAFASSLAGASLAGCTSLINQNTDGNQVYTSADGEESGSPKWTEGQTSSADDSSGSTVDSEATGGASTQGSGTGGEDTGGNSTGGGSIVESGTGAEDTGESTGGGEIEPPQPGDGDAVEVVTGSSVTCVRTKAGKVRCWGLGTWGQHGLATTANFGYTDTPDALPDVQVGFDVVQVVVGDQFVCGRSAIGKVRCWGRGTHGVLGIGSLDTIGDDEHPANSPEVTLSWPAVEIAAGTNHACALSGLGAVQCWGEALEGQLGYGNKKNIGDDELPATAGEVQVGGPVAHLFAGGSTTCAVLEKGGSRCWGRGGTHGSGVDAIGDNEVPSSVPLLELPWPVEEFASGPAHTCARAAVANGGEVRCFGNPALYPPAWGQGQLGSGNLNPIWEAADAPPVALEWPAAEISTFNWHTCARSPLGKLKCWGTGWAGRLGYGNQENVGDDETPADVGDVYLGFEAEQVSTGYLHTCAIRAGGKLRCWGWNLYGELGIGTGGMIGDDEEPYFGPDTMYQP